MRSTISMIESMNYYLTETLQATNEEIDYLKHLCVMKSNRTNASRKLRDILKPSMIIDNFLYHGDLQQARNINVLKELDIRHIINVCDCPLDEEIVNNFNVLWIKIGDELDVDIHQYFDKTNHFLNSCKQKNEKVLVNCVMGVSRSSSIILAYLLK